MFMKIFAAKRATEDGVDTGTHPDGYQVRDIAFSKLNGKSDRSSHERDYGVGRKVSELPVGFA